MIELTTVGRRIRVLVTVAGLLLLVAGTFWGDDDEFPFGPFRMYASAPDPNGAAKDTRVEGVDSTGAVVVITEANSGIRRAEIEGQQSQYEADPSRLEQVIKAYEDHTPGAPELREVRIVIRWHLVKDSRPTGTYTDDVIAKWVRS